MFMLLEQSAREISLSFKAFTMNKKTNTYPIMISAIIEQINLDIRDKLLNSPVWFDVNVLLIILANFEVYFTVCHKYQRPC